MKRRVSSTPVTYKQWDGRRARVAVPVPDAAGSAAAARPTRYANTLEVGFNAFEFLLDLGHMFGPDPEGVMHTRIVTTPFFARDFLSVLAHSVGEYETAFGAIQERFGSPEAMPPERSAHD